MIYEIIKKNANHAFDFMDFNDLWDKERAFIDFINADTNNIVNILIDDAVSTKVIISEKHTVILINVRDLNEIIDLIKG